MIAAIYAVLSGLQDEMEGRTGGASFVVCKDSVGDKAGEGEMGEDVSTVARCETERMGTRVVCGCPFNFASKMVWESKPSASLQCVSPGIMLARVRL